MSNQNFSSNGFSIRAIYPSAMIFRQTWSPCTIPGRFGNAGFFVFKTHVLFQLSGRNARSLGVLHVLEFSEGYGGCSLVRLDNSSP